MRPVLFLLPAVFAAPAFSHPIYTNEPGHLRSFSDQPFDSLTGGCWNNYGNGSIRQDSSAPASGPNVLYSERPKTSGGGAKEVCFLTVGGSASSEVFVGMHWKASNPYIGWSNNTNKIINLEAGALWVEHCGATGSRTFCILHPNPDSVSNSHVAGAKTCGNPAGGTCVYHTSVRATEGVWHKVEWYAKVSSCSTCKDGATKLWINGSLAGEWYGLNFVDGLRFQEFQQTASWDRAPDADYGNASTIDSYFFDHIYLATVSGGTGSPGGGSAPPPPPTLPPPPPAATAPGTVTDLAAAAAGSGSVSLTFTQVGDGTGAPAKYFVRYSDSGALWGQAPDVSQGTCAGLQGTATSGSLRCTATGLKAATRYEFQIVAYRGTPNVDAVFGQLSNVASATTAAATASTDLNGDGATNITDVQLAINQSLGLSACSAGDVNGDGQCTILDVQRIVNAAMGG